MAHKDMTICEKILARTSGKQFVSPGEVLWATPDIVLMYDYPGLTDEFARILKDELHSKIHNPSQCKLFIDHMVPASGVKESDFHHGTRRWAEEQGVELFEGLGIGHQVSAEIGLARPGMLITHSDLHVQPLGAFGAMTISLLTDIITPYALGKIWIEVPHTIKVTLNNEFMPGVDGRDLINRILGDLGPDGAINSVLEFVGDGSERMSIDNRMTSLSETVFCGAYGGIYPANSMVSDYLKKRTNAPYTMIKSDAGARYSFSIEYDLSDIEPTLIKPNGLTAATSIEQVVGVPLNQGYIGSCASGRLSDLKTSAAILKGKKIAKGFRLYVVPSSREIMSEASRLGYLTTLIDAGAFISSPSCDYCYGKVQSISAGETAISAGTLNVPGRMGSVEANIYLSSSAVVAASAIEGRIVDPRNYL